MKAKNITVRLVVRSLTLLILLSSLLASCIVVHPRPHPPSRRHKHVVIIKDRRY